MPTRTAPHRRGISMLLVLVSLAMATILSASYLASRDNSAFIGRNVANATAARWAAEAGIELGVAILETDADWRTVHVGGRLLDDYAIDGATVDIDLVDIITGAPPTDRSSEVEIIATATVNGSSQVARTLVTIGISEEDPIDLDLSEFAIFALGSVRLDNDAIVTRWPQAPLSSMGERLHVGTTAGGAGVIDLNQDAAAIDTTVFLPPGASPMAVTVEGTVPVHTFETQSAIPVPGPPDPGVLNPDFVLPGVDVPLIARSFNVLFDTRRNSFQLSSNSTLSLIGDVVLTVDDDLRIENSVVTVNGHATIVVWDDLLMTDGAIEVMPGASLTLFVGDDVNMVRSYVGDQRADGSVRDNSGDASWADPEDVRVFRADWTNAGDATPATSSWTVEQNSVIKGSLYVPGVDLRLRDDSALYGRVSADSVHLDTNAALFYDPALDPKTGYTNPDSVVYKDDGTIEDSILAIAKLDDTMLQACADALGRCIEDPKSDADLQPAVPAPEDPEPPLLPTEPTPRTVSVVRHSTSLGTVVEDWELASAK